MSFETYRKQVDLLLDALPIVARHREFALKGGTAINLFYLDMPRLSVDIDLCYLLVEDRKTTLANIHSGLLRIKKELEIVLKCKVTPTRPLDGKSEARLVVSRDSTDINIEPNYIIRGAVFTPSNLTTTNKVSEIFQKSAEVPCLNRSDLYGGKICAALDRQHPRDLFDMYKFFGENATIDENTCNAFIFYPISHNRPFHELLEPNDKPLKSTFESEFIGMTTDPIDLEQLLQIQRVLKHKIMSVLDEKARSFIVSVAKGEPDWTLFQYPKIQNYPSVLCTSSQSHVLMTVQ